MKFHEYKTLWKEIKNTLPRHVTEEQFYAVAMAGGVRAGNGLVLAEGIWKRLRRPYYQVYPAIIPALLNLRLDIQTSLIHTPMPALLVRLPADKPIDELPGVQTALMCQDAPGEDLRLWVNFMRPTGLANMHITLGCEPGKTLEQSFQESAANTQNYVISGNFVSEEHFPLVQDCLRLSRCSACWPTIPTQLRPTFWPTTGRNTKPAATRSTSIARTAAARWAGTWASRSRSCPTTAARTRHWSGRVTAGQCRGS